MLVPRSHATHDRDRASEKVNNPNPDRARRSQHAADDLNLPAAVAAAVVDAATPLTEGEQDTLELSEEAVLRLMA